MLALNPRDVWCRNFGLEKPSDLFTPRQLTSLNAFTTLIDEAAELARKDAGQSGATTGEVSLAEGGEGSLAYSEALRVYLSIIVDRLADYNSTLCRAC